MGSEWPDAMGEGHKCATGSCAPGHKIEGKAANSQPDVFLVIWGPDGAGKVVDTFFIAGGSASRLV